MNQNQPPMPTPQTTPPINPQQSSQTNPNLPQNNDKTLNTVIAIILLLFVFPAGLIYMWLATSWSKGLKWFLTILFFLLILSPIILYIFIGFKTNQNEKAASKQAGAEVSEYVSYISSINKIEFSYPKGWYIDEKIPGIVNVDMCKPGDKTCSGGPDDNIGIAYQGQKTPDTSLLTYIINKNQKFFDTNNYPYKASDYVNEAKNSNGYEVVSEAKTNYYISDGIHVFTVDQPNTKQINPATIKKIVDSLKINTFNY